MSKKDYLNAFKSLDEYYSNAWKYLHMAISDYILPRRGNFVERGKPYEPQNVLRADLIINDTATRCNRILGSGMQGGLCSHARRWFRLTTVDPQLAKFPPVKAWLQLVEDDIYRVYSGSNFYTEIHKVFEEEGGFGTSVILQDEDAANIVNFTVFTAGEYRLAMSTPGVIDTCYRHYWMEASQIYNMFGPDNVSDAVKTTYKNNPHEYFEVIRCIRPRSSYNPNSMSNTRFRYESVWFELQSDEDKFLRDSGYQDLPFAAPRWSPTSNSPYGLGPGHDCIGNVQMLKEMEKSGLKAVHKEVDPPMIVSSTFKDILNQLPGAINYSDSEDVRHAGAPLFNVNYNLRNAEYKIEKMEERISRTYYNDVFLMIIQSEHQGRPITATEILERKEEKLILLGPTVERQTTELFDPTISRTFSIRYRGGAYPPPPPELEGQPLKVKYTGVLAQAQRLSDAQAMRVYRDEARAVVEVDPMTIVKTDWNKYLDEFADIVGVPTGIVRSPEETEDMQADIAEAQAEREQMERTQQAVLAMKEMGRASTSGGNVLSDIAEEATGG